jgi:hypothetical protein
MSMEDKWEELNRLMRLIHEAVDSEQPEPRAYSIETEVKLQAVFKALKQALGLT